MMINSTGSKWRIGLPIIGFWMVMMGLLAYREYGGILSTPRTAEATLLREDTEIWMGLFVGKERVGHIHMSQAPEERHETQGTNMELEVRAKLNLLGQVTDIDLSGSVWRPYEQRRADFNFGVKSTGYNFQLRGLLADGMLQANVLTAGETIPLSFPVDEDLVFASGFGTTMSFPSLQVGEEVQLESFDPMTLQKSSLKVRCVAEETLHLPLGELASDPVLARRLDVQAGGIQSQVWIDEGGEVLQMKTPIGLTLRRIRSEDDIPLSENDHGQEFLRFTAVRPQGKQPFRGARSSVMRLTMPSQESLPEDRIQMSLGGGEYRWTQPSEPNGTLAETEVTRDPALGNYLEPDAFVQSDHPQIRDQASRIFGEETDPWQRALAIHHWVYKSIKKDPVVSIPSALEVLKQRRGDCNEHTVLFTALARAAQIPTRIAIGLVWSDDLDAFYYHAWPEVHIGDWIWMDPTLGQPRADATHIKLLNGGIETWTGLLPLLGQLEIEVLEMM